MRRAFLLLGVGSLLLSACPVSAQPTGSKRIEHVVVVVLENSTFDHTFGAFPGADGVDPKRDVIYDLNGEGLEPRPLEPEDLGREGTFAILEGEEALSNGLEAAETAWQRGKMTGFARAQERRQSYAELAMSHFTKETFSGPWALAEEYVLFDRWFSSQLGDSLPNTLHLIAGDAHGIERGTRETLAELWTSRFPTIFDRLEENGNTWGYYIGGLDAIDEDYLRSGGYFSPESPSTPSQLYWSPVLSIGRFWREPLRDGLQEQGQFFADAATGDLPDVSYLLPSPNTHWPTAPDESSGRMISIVNAVKKSGEWENTAIYFVWDDWGGFFDHVPPPERGGHQLGFRVPALLVSGAAAEGEIVHTEHDHTSIPAFVAETFDLEPVGKQYTDASLDEAFTDRPARPNRALALRGATRYRAAGAEHAPTVFTMYLIGLAAVAAAFPLVRRWKREAPTPETRSER